MGQPLQDVIREDQVEALGEDAGRGMAAGIPAHRRRASVIGVAVDGDTLSRDALEVLHDPNGHALTLQHRPLLDVQFGIDVRHEEARLLGPGIVDSLKLRPENGTVCANRRQCFLDPEPTGIDEGAHHVASVGRACLVGEGRDSNRPGRGGPGRFQGLDHLQPGEHPIAAVIDARINNGINVRAEQDGGFVSVVRSPPDPDDVADAINRNFQACGLDPCDESVASRLLGIGAGEPDQPAITISPDLTEPRKGAELAAPH